MSVGPGWPSGNVATVSAVTPTRPASSCTARAFSGLRPGVRDAPDLPFLQPRQVETHLSAGKARQMQVPVLLHGRAGANLVGGDDACPGLDEGGLGETRAFLHRQEVASLVAFEDLLADDHVLGKTAGDRVAERYSLALVVDVCLDDVATSQGELALPLFPDADDRHCDLVTGNRRILRKIAALDPRMCVPRRDQLDVGETQADGVDAGDQIVLRVAGKGNGIRPALCADILESRPFQLPREYLFGQVFEELHCILLVGRGRPAIRLRPFIAFLL